MSRIAILGSGALGTALSIALHKRDRTIYIWSVEPDVVEALRGTHENQKYLPGSLIPPAIHVTLEMSEALQDAEAAIITVPSYGVREVARRAVRHLPEGTIIVCAARGLEEGTHKRMSEVIQEELPPDLPAPVVAIHGPCLAPEIAQGSVAALDVACENLDAARRARQLLSTSKFKLKPTNDIAGAEAGSTFNTAYAIGAGIGDGLGWGMSERAAYLAKSLAEIARLAAALGGKRPTLYGLSGLGDLAATAFSPLSRNRTVGEEIARGRNLREILTGIVSVVEGVAACRAAHAIATEYHIRLSLAEALNQIVHEGGDPKLLQRALTASR
jgi:glycerol-3-phosphate dehydrogenase (NAD(P)+)